MEKDGNEVWLEEVVCAAGRSFGFLAPNVMQLGLGCCCGASERLVCDADIIIQTRPSNLGSFFSSGVDTSRSAASYRLYFLHLPLPLLVIPQPLSYLSTTYMVRAIPCMTRCISGCIIQGPWSGAGVLTCLIVLYWLAFIPIRCILSSVVSCLLHHRNPL